MSHGFEKGEGTALDSFIIGKAIERTISATAQAHSGRRVNWAHPNSAEALGTNMTSILREEGFFANSAMIIRRG